nr:transposase (putative), gypsy type [Tanacetum cinerariifolium]
YTFILIVFDLQIFVKSVDPFKVKVEERTLDEGEVPLLTEAADMAVTSSDQMVHLVSYTIMDTIKEHSGKSKRKKLIAQSGQADFGYGSAASRAKVFVSSSVTSTPDHEDHEDSGSTHDGNVQTRRVSESYVVITYSSEHEDANNVASHMSTSPKPHVHTEVENVTAGPVNGTGGTSIPGNEAGTSSIPRDETEASSFVPNDALELVCDGLKSQVAKLEADCESLHNEVVGEAKMREEFMSMQDATTRCFDEQCNELDACIAELNHDMDVELYLYMLTAVARRRWVIGHGFWLAVMKRAQSIECSAASGKVISMAIKKGIQEGLEAGIEHGKAGRSLAEVDAYDYEDGAAYVAAVNEFENVSFTLLEQLETLKDSPLELFMSALTVEGVHGDGDPTPEFCKLQHVSEQVIVPVYFERGGSRDPDSISHEILLSDALSASRARYEKHKKTRLKIGSPFVVTLSQSSHEASLVVVDPQALGAANVDSLSRMMICLTLLSCISMWTLSSLDLMNF